MNRFIAIIEDPGRVWTNYAVVDTTRGVRMCSCSDTHNADMIAAILNERHREKFAKLIGKTITAENAKSAEIESP